jgi:LmbE family N-acetylglucosaminyl deacetylase
MNNGSESTKILVIAAHPDDEVLGCGGTIARMAQEGHVVNIGILGEGVTSRFEKREDADKGLIESLKENCRQSANSLGAQEPIFFDMPDNRFDTVPILKVVKHIETLINKLNPKIIFTQHGGDLNVDHAITFRATLIACRPVKGCTVRDIYAYEVPSSTEWSFNQFHPVFNPTMFMDISAHIETKIQAIQNYKGEIRSTPHPRSPEAIRAVARRWGAVVGFDYVEAFQTIRSVK